MERVKTRINAQTTGLKGDERDAEVTKIKSEGHAVEAKIARNKSGTVEMSAIERCVKVDLRASRDTRSRALTRLPCLPRATPKSPARHVPYGQGPRQNPDRSGLAWTPEDPTKEAPESVVPDRSTFLFRRSRRRENGRETLPLMLDERTSAHVGYAGDNSQARVARSRTCRRER